MRNIFIDMKEFFKTYGNLIKHKQEKVLSNRVTKSRKIEDKMFKEVTDSDSEYEILLKTGKDKRCLFAELARDCFQCFYSLNPVFTDNNELTVKAQTQNAPIIEKLLQSDSYLAIKNICEGKSLQAKAAAEDFLKNVLNNSEDIDAKINGENNVPEVLNSQSEIFQNNLSQLEEMHNKYQTEPTTANEKKLLETINKAEQKIHQIDALKKMTENNKARANQCISDAVSSAMESAFNEALTVNAIITSWGCNEANTTDFQANSELIDKVRKNKKLLEIAKYLGPYKEMLYAKRKNAFTYGRGEKYSIEYGNNLSDVVGAEFTLLADTSTLPLFLRKYQNKQLKQYKKRDKSDKTLGDIIICIDESASMRKDNKEEWSKAVACVLAEAAISRNRNAAFVHFSSQHDCMVDIITSQNYSPNTMMDYMSSFIGGGTNYERPLEKSVELIEKKQMQNADIVFITDGECAISKDFSKWFQQQKSSMRFTVTGILLDKDEKFNFSLRPFCNEIYQTSTTDRDIIAFKILK